jgi:hypothetical protein
LAEQNQNYILRKHQAVIRQNLAYEDNKPHLLLYLKGYLMLQRLDSNQSGKVYLIAGIVNKIGVTCQKLAQVIVAIAS